MRRQVWNCFTGNKTALLWVAVLLLSASSALADGFFLPEPARRVPTIPSQRALLTYHQGEENLLIQSSFVADGGSDFGWIIPLPATPTRFKAVADDSLLEVFSLATEPSVITHYEGFWFALLMAVGMLVIAILFLAFKGLPFRVLAGLLLANTLLAFYLSSPAPDPYRGHGGFAGMSLSLGADMRSVRGVAVEASEKVGNYDVVALKADGAAALDAWLTGNGYQSLPTAARQTVDDLAREQWRFVAARLHLADAASSATVRPHPIMLTFPTARPIYPMRLTAHAGSNVNLELFIVADRRAQCSPLRLEYCDDFSDRQLVEDLQALAPAESESPFSTSQSPTTSSLNSLLSPLAVWPGCVLTRLGGVVTPNQMKTDYTFTLKPPKPFRLTLYTCEAAARKAGVWALGLWSLGVALVLFVFSLKTRYQRFAVVLLRRAPDQPSRRSACFRACLALGVCALALYLGVDASLDKPHPGETVVGGADEIKPRIADLFSPDETYPRENWTKAKPETVNLRVRFRDRSTRQPLDEVQGCLMNYMTSLMELTVRGDFESACREKSDRLQYFKADHSGLAVVTNFIRSNSEDTTVLLAGVAPGHVSQTFQIPIEQIRSGKDLVLDLAPEARVQGRMLLAETGEPLNKDTVRTLLQRKGKWAKLLEKNHGYEPNLHPRITMHNWTLEENRPSYRDSSFVDFFSVPIGRDGRFEFKGLQPHQAWVCESEWGGLPKLYRYPVALKPGVNDLGDLRVGLAGDLNGKIVDDTGAGVPDATVQFPIEGLRSETPCEQTSATGEFHFDLTSFTHERQIMRITPRWSVDPEDGVHAAYQQRLVYEAIMPLDRTSSHTLTTRIDRGHTLLIELPPSALRDKLVQFYRDPRNHPHNDNSRLDPAGLERFLAVSGATIQALEANKEGLVYHRYRELPQGLPLTSGTIVLRVNHVPPGRHALRLDGGFYVTRPATRYEPSHFIRRRQRIMRISESLPQPPKNEQSGTDTIPLAFTEFEMKATTTTVRLALSPTDVKFELEGLPQELNAGKVSHTLVFLERPQPLSTVFAAEVRRTLLDQHRWLEGDAMESRLLPMMGYFISFLMADGPHASRLRYRPHQIPAVPPGRYRLQAFTGVDDFQKAVPVKPYYETEIQVPADGKEILVKVPYQAAQDGR